MPLEKLKFAPGINRERTTYANNGTYWDGDKIRFVAGVPQKIGGWTNYAPEGLTFLGACRSLLIFDAINGANITALGTNLKVYVESGGVVYDITPSIENNVITGTGFTTDTGEPDLIQINDPGAITAVGQFVVLSGVTGSINGVPASELNGEHRVVEFGTGYFKIAITTAPTSSGTAGDVTIDYLYPTASAVYSIGLGWGTGGWGGSNDAGDTGWGEPSLGGVGLQLRLWNLAQYGSALVYGARGGALYFWEYVDQTSLLNRGQLISDLPGANEVPLYHNDVLVSDQSRFVITIGSNDYGDTDANPMLVRWSDQENYLEWEPMATTQAGSIILSTGSELITMRQARQEILIWSDIALYSMQFVGAPLVFSFNIIADSVTIMGPRAVIVVDNIAYWMGRDKFYVYTGRVEPLPCSVRRYVFEDFNYDQAWQTYCNIVSEFGEVWWFYCSKNSAYIDRYVVFNYVENCWYYGMLARTAWLDSGLKQNPIATGYDPETEIGTLYYHEFGVDDNTTAPATPIPAFIETADFDIETGDRFAFVTRILPDITFEGSETTNPSAMLELLPRRFSGSAYTDKTVPAVIRSAATPVEQYTEQVFVRYRGRQMAFRVSSHGRGVMWQLGTPRIDVRLDGKK